MATTGAADAAVAQRASMRTPPLFEPVESKASVKLDAPTRHSIIFTQPVADPTWRNSSILYEPRAKKTNSAAAQNLSILDSAAIAKKNNRNTVFLETPTRPTGAAASPQRSTKSSSMRHSAVGTTAGLTDIAERTPVQRRPVGAGASIDRGAQRHTVATGPTISITRDTDSASRVSSPLMEHDDAGTSSSSTLRNSPSPPMNARGGSMLNPSLPPMRPPIRSETSDLYDVHEEKTLAPASNIQRPSLHAQNTDSSFTNQPLMRKSQLRPNANEIRKRRQSRASRAASVPLSNSFGVGITSMTYGGNNAGLKDMSHGQFGMNQNFGLVSHRASQWLAEEEQREDYKRKQRSQKDLNNLGRGAGLRKPEHKAKRMKKWMDVLTRWAKTARHGKYNEERREIRKERIQHMV